DRQQVAAHDELPVARRRLLFLALISTEHRAGPPVPVESGEVSHAGDPPGTGGSYWRTTAERSKGMSEEHPEATIAEVVAAVRKDRGAARADPPAGTDAEVLAAVYRWFDAWNARDPAAVAASIADRGGFSEPSIEGAIRGDALADHVRALVAQFPDLSFDLLAESVIAANTAMAEWLLRGTDASLGRTVAV